MSSASTTDGTDGEHLVTTETVEPGIVVVRLNRPDRLNALSQSLIAGLHETFARMDGDRSVRVIILTGAGRGFSAGADLKADGSDPTPGTEGMAPIQATFAAQEHLAALHERIHRLRQPVIAAVNGAAVGGGFSLTLACDIRVASTTARFGAVFITVGVSACDMGTSYFLPRLVGASKSAELMLTGRIFDAVEAQQMGLVIDVVEPDELMERALVSARQIVKLSPMAVAMTKETMWQTIDAPSLRHALDMENRTQIVCFATGEMSEASAAFREQRPPQWKTV